MKFIKKMVILLLISFSIISFSSCDILNIILGEEAFDVSYENYDIGDKPTKIKDVYELPTLPILEEEGYEFLGWYYDELFLIEAKSNDLLIDDTTLYARWNKLSYIITFDNNGIGNNLSQFENVYKIKNLPTLEASGYKFLGWYYEKDFKNIVKENDILKNNVTIYAKWEKISYKVEYVISNHGQQPSSLYNVSSLPDTLPILIEEGYIFGGWYYDQNYIKEARANDVLSGDTVLYAKWLKEGEAPVEKIVDNIVYDDLQIHFLELGNDYTGDSTYIKAGDIDILIDAGSRKGSAATIKSYVDQYCTDGVLEYVIATHADQDHIAGFVGNSENSTRTGILYQYKVETIIDFALTNKTTQIYKDYIKARDYAVSNGATHYTAAQCFNETDGAKSVYNLTDDISMEILYNYYYFNDSDDENNFSVCTLVTYNEHNFMFTGDLEYEGEEKMAHYYDGSSAEKTLPHVELFKAGHHGSKTSSNECLLSKIQPEIVCVCCCAGGSEYTANYQNTFPTQDMITRVAKYTDRVYVTSVYDEKKLEYDSFNGNIVISSNGVNVGVFATNNIIKLKDSEWFNETVYINSSGNYCSGKGKKDYFTSETSGVKGVPRRVWPS